MQNHLKVHQPASIATEREREFRSWLVALLVLLLTTFLVVPLTGAQEPDPDAGVSEFEEPDPASSEDEAADAPLDHSGIEEIVVRGAESAATADFEASDSVTAFGAEDLEAIGAQDVADIAAFTPNLEIVTSGATTPTFFIRGVGLNDFNANSTGAVAIYQDDVVINAPALQLATLFDVEAVTVLRGPQGTGSARNASAGAIKIYSRKPTGEFNGFLRSDFGNFGFMDYEGAIETPIYQDILSSRFAFRYSDRDGTMLNRCGNATPIAERVPVPTYATLRQEGKLNTDAPWSICGEPVEGGVNFFDARSPIAEGLPLWVNDTHNWAARGTFLFQPTLDMTWLLNGHGSRRDEWTRLGQSIGTRGFYCANGDVENCGIQGTPSTARIEGVLGGSQGNANYGYQPREIRARLLQLAPCFAGIPLFPDGTCNRPENRASANSAKVQVANEVARDLDSDPWAGDFNMCSKRRDENGEFIYRDATGARCKPDTGRTTNDTWGGYLKGDMELPWGGIQLETVTGYDAYDRFIDIDLDFSPETLFHIQTKDEGWQVMQDLQLTGEIGEEAAIRWEVGAYFLREQLNVRVQNDLGIYSAFGVGQREYTQDLWSAAGYFHVAFDFWEDFTLDGGFRYNWEQKKLDYALFRGGDPESLIVENLDETWSAPTGTLRLTYRFREDTHVFWKYSRGWKPGTYNATSSPEQGVSVARPEQIDAFETGVRGSWFDGRLGLESAFFYYDYFDYQLFIAQQFANGNPEFVILNADAAEVYGAEVEATLRPWEGAFANIRFGWLESEFLDFVQIQQETIVQFGAQKTVNRELQNTGNPLLNSPKFKVSLTGEQTLPLGDWGDLTARYDGVWTDTTYYDATRGRGIPNVQNIDFLPKDTIAQDPFWLHNLRVSYRPAAGSFEIAGWVRNLTNQSYKTFAFDGSTFNQTTIYFVGDPRTYGGSLTYSW